MLVFHQYFVDVILPLPLERNFTYAITEAESKFIKPGVRVSVPFGKNKIYTGIVLRLHNDAPSSYDCKSIHSILDSEPIVTSIQLNLWNWMSNYYMCFLGDVMSASLPGAFLLKSETLISLLPNAVYNLKNLNDDEYLVIEALQQQSILKLEDIQSILSKKNIFSVVNPMIKSKILTVRQKLVEKFKPKLVRCIRLSKEFSSNDFLEKLEMRLYRAKKLRSIVLSFFSLKKENSTVKVSDLKLLSSASSSQIKSLISKGVFEEFFIEVDRLKFNYSDKKKSINLSNEQARSLREIKLELKSKSVCLFHGVTSSGKTEIYIKYIEEVILSGKQVLFLVPEIALTSQLVFRFKDYFGSKVIVYHSRFNPNERVEIWNKVLENSEEAKIIIGARSSVLLPFKKLGLVIVDEEHETSYKQFDPTPRYQARDTAIVLANFFNAKTILGSATPSLESYFNAVKTNKYGYVSLDKRYNNIMLPKIELVDLADSYKRKRMNGHFSHRLIKEIGNTLDSNHQVILFQNRRGYAPIINCNTCGYTPQCSNCDVSLTYHQKKQQLRCHYCSYNISLIKQCIACGGFELDYKGFGTEQIQEQVKKLFPNSSVKRMDYDTTRGKYSYDKIIESFEKREVDILVGTQMLTKGLDFRFVKLVGVLNADQLINFPDFRSHERSYQLLQQVAGRSGRTDIRGQVLIQSFNPNHKILQQVSSNDYNAMFEEQLYQRRIYKYPPYYRLIKITLKHRDYNLVNNGSEWLRASLSKIFGEYLLGPEFPAVSRVRNLYHKNLLIKIPDNYSLSKSKKAVEKIRQSFMSTKNYRPMKLIINVDNY